MIEIQRTADHQYVVNGQSSQGVTNIIKPLMDLFAVDEAAATRGRLVHRITAMWDRGTLDVTSIDDRLIPYFAAYELFLDDCKPKIIEIEMKVASQQYGVAGTLDRILQLEGPRDLMDIKSGAFGYCGPQLALYGQCYTETTGYAISGRYGLALKDTGKYKLEKFTEPSDFTVAVACLTIRNWRNKR